MTGRITGKAYEKHAWMLIFVIGLQVSTAEQNRSKGRRKTGPFSVMRYAVLRVVPLAAWEVPVGPPGQPWR